VRETQKLKQVQGVGKGEGTDNHSSPPRQNLIRKKTNFVKRPNDRIESAVKKRGKKRTCKPFSLRERGGR